VDLSPRRGRFEGTKAGRVRFTLVQGARSGCTAAARFLAAHGKPSAPGECPFDRLRRFASSASHATSARTDSNNRVNLAWRRSRAYCNELSNQATSSSLSFPTVPFPNDPATTLEQTKGPRLTAPAPMAGEHHLSLRTQSPVSSSFLYLFSTALHATL
jgi:hypothetical protein